MIQFDAQKFLQEIERTCRQNNIEYIDAVIDYCERNKLEVEYIASIIKRDPVIKSKIQAEAEGLNILKRGARLPI